MKIFGSSKSPTELFSSAARTAQPHSPLLSMHWREDLCSLELWERSTGRWKQSQAIDFDWRLQDAISEDGYTNRGGQLRELLALHKIESKHAVVSLPRERVIFKRLDLPVLDEALVADAITLQLESRGIAAPEFIIDYVSHEPHDEARRMVYSVSAPHALIDEISRVLVAAGLQPQSIGLSDIGLCHLALQDVSGLNLLLHFDHRQLQCIVTRDRLPVSSMSFPWPGHDPDLAFVIQATMDRLLRGLPASLVAEGFQTVRVIGACGDAIVDTLRQTFKESVQVLASQPTGSIEGWSVVSEGLLPAKNRINFLTPKRGPDRIAIRQRKNRTLGVRAALTLGLVAVLGQFHFMRLGDQTQRMDREYRSVLASLEQMQSAQDRAWALTEWKSKQLDLPEEIGNLLAAIPENDKAYLKSLSIDHTVGDLAEVRLEGLARELDEALNLNQRLLEYSPRYQVRPDQVQQHDSDPHYQVQFIVSAAVDAQSDIEERPLQANAGE